MSKPYDGCIPGDEPDLASELLYTWRTKAFPEAAHREIMLRATRAVRRADKMFSQTGGTSRHWVRGCFLPSLALEGLGLVLMEPKDEQQTGMGSPQSGTKPI